MTVLDSPRGLPPEGEYVLTLTLLNAAGRMQYVHVALTAAEWAQLTERGNWDRIFYPAVLALGATPP